MDRELANKPTDKWVAFNPLSRRYEEVCPESELMPGETIIRMCYHRSAGRYVTIPGASLYKVDEDYAWVPVG